MSDFTAAQAEAIGRILKREGVAGDTYASYERIDDQEGRLSLEDGRSFSISATGKWSEEGKGRGLFS